MSALKSSRRRLFLKKISSMVLADPANTAYNSREWMWASRGSRPCTWYMKRNPVCLKRATSKINHIIHIREASNEKWGEKNVFTFNKKSKGQSKAVKTDWQPFDWYAGNHRYSWDSKEQIHCAVLPVHQLDPWVIFPVVEVGVWAVHDKLLHHNTCHRNNISGDRALVLVSRKRIVFLSCLTTTSFTKLHLRYEMCFQY